MKGIHVVAMGKPLDAFNSSSVSFFVFFFFTFWAATSHLCQVYIIIQVSEAAQLSCLFFIPSHNTFFIFPGDIIIVVDLIPFCCSCYCRVVDAVHPLVSILPITLYQPANQLFTATTTTYRLNVNLGHNISNLIKKLYSLAWAEDEEEEEGGGGCTTEP